MSPPAYPPFKVRVHVQAKGVAAVVAVGNLAMHLEELCTVKKAARAVVATYDIENHLRVQSLCKRNAWLMPWLWEVWQCTALGCDTCHGGDECCAGQRMALVL